MTTEASAGRTSSGDILSAITPVILTFNEEANIERTLEAMAWAQCVIVLDSFSTDNTTEIAERYPNVELHRRTFDDHTAQWNHAIDLVRTEWVLAFDADYLLTGDLLEEIRTLDPSNEICGYFIPFRYCVLGTPLRGSILPPREALFRSDMAYYVEDGHTQLLESRGKSGNLSQPILHDDRKPLSRWLMSQDNYAVLEAEKISSTAWSERGVADKIRSCIVLAPWIVPIYCLIVKGGLLDGWNGWFYAMQRTLAELLLSVRLVERRIVKSLVGRPQA